MADEIEVPVTKQWVIDNPLHAVEEITRLRKKLTAVEVERNNAVFVAWDRGAVQWATNNYPALVAGLDEPKGCPECPEQARVKGADGEREAALMGKVERMKKELAEEIASNGDMLTIAHMDGAHRASKRARAEIERLTRERDKAIQDRETRVAKMRDAMQEIADCECIENDSEWMRRHARAALEE